MSHDDSESTLPAHANGAAGRYDVQHKQPKTSSPLIRSPWRAMIQDFSPVWFTWCMNSGIIGILLHQHPYQFNGIHTLSAIFFMLDLVLFLTFSTLFLLRFALFGSQAYREITNDISQLTLCACWTIGYLTLPPSVSLNVSEAYWGGRWAMILAYVMWWIGLLWTLVTLFFVFAIISRRHLAGGPSDDTSKHNTHSSPLPTLVIIPAVSVATCSVTGGVVASYSAYIDARLAVPIIITGFPLLGLGLILGLILYAILFRQQLETGFPPPPQITSLFVYIGPMGQCAAALQALGSGARSWFHLYDRGAFLTAQAAPALDAACVMLALLLLGPAFFFTIFSCYAVIDCAITTKKVRWSPSWNSVIFPTATMTTATTYLSNELDSTAFKIITSIQLICLVIVFFVNVGFTLFGIFKGDLLIVREDPRVKKQLEEDQKER